MKTPELIGEEFGFVELFTFSSGVNHQMSSEVIFPVSLVLTVGSIAYKITYKCMSV